MAFITNKNAAFKKLPRHAANTPGVSGPDGAGDQYPTFDVNWSSTDTQEMKCFIRIIILTGIHNLPEYCNYRSSDLAQNVPYVSKKKSRQRYEKLCEYFHCSDPNNADPEDKLHKVRPLLDVVGEHFLFPNRQSAYRRYHSMETAILKSPAVDSSNLVFLILLYLSAASECQPRRITQMDAGIFWSWRICHQLVHFLFIWQHTMCTIKEDRLNAIDGPIWRSARFSPGTDLVSPVHCRSVAVGESPSPSSPCICQRHPGLWVL